MSRLKSLLKKAEGLLEDQWESFAALDRWIQSERSVPDTVKEEWRRIYQLQEFFQREHFQKLLEEASSWDDARHEAAGTQFVRDILSFLAKQSPVPHSFVQYLTATLRADRGMLLSCSEESSQARVLAAANAGDSNLTMEEYQLSRTVFRDILRSGRSVLIKNALEDKAYADQTSILHSGVHSILAGPIRAQDKTVGILYLDSQRLERVFSETDRECLDQVLPIVKLLFFSCAGASESTPGRGEVFLDDHRALRGLVGRSAEFADSIALLKRVAPTPAPVLLMGESGTGKELFARAIHALSSRKNGPFVPINCAAIPETLIESELFGHEKGAFTGADTMRVGKIERASRGTLFLDEIGEMKFELQAKLLRFLQSGEVERVGGAQPIHVETRVIAATNRDLGSRVAEGSFRQDLYFRLNVFRIALPPLRQRKDDLRPLADHFFQKYAAVLDLRNLEIRPEVYNAFEEYSFPGNIRELENIVYRALLLSGGGRVTLDCLPDELLPGTLRNLEKNPLLHLLKTIPADYDELSDRKEQMKQIVRREIAHLERRFAEALVSRAGGSITKAAEMAGIDRGQFHRLLKPGEPD